MGWVGIDGAQHFQGWGIHSQCFLVKVINISTGGSLTNISCCWFLINHYCKMGMLSETLAL